MDDIYLLTKTTKSFFGDEPNKFEVIGWTDSREKAKTWKNESNMLVIKEIQIINKVT